MALGPPVITRLPHCVYLGAEMYTWAWGSRGVVDSWAECYRFWSVVDPGDVSHAHNQPGWIVSWGAVVSGLVSLLASGLIGR